MFFYGIDPLYWVFMLPALALSGWAAWATRGRFRRYGQVATHNGLSGARVARAILDKNGLQGVPVEAHQGFLSDHYDPRAKAVRLSPDVYQGASISAVAVAAHETGHALQDKAHYLPLKLRNAAVPIASIGSNFAFVLIFAGAIIGWLGLAKIGVALFSGVVFFQLVTLPVELDASRRAKRILLESGLITEAERKGVSKVLSAAAMTYVAAALTAVLTLLYFLLRLGLLGGRDE